MLPEPVGAPYERPAYQYFNDLPGYRVKVVPLDNGNFYWHLWRGPHRVNGGLSESRHDASRDAAEAAFRDNLQEKLDALPGRGYRP